MKKRIREKILRIRVNPDEVAWLGAVAQKHDLTLSALVRHLAKREYDAMRLAERQMVGLESDDLSVLRLMAAQDLPQRRWEIQFLLRSQSPYDDVQSWLPRRLRKLKRLGYVERVGKMYTLTTRGHGMAA